MTRGCAVWSANEGLVSASVANDYRIENIMLLKLVEDQNRAIEDARDEIGCLNSRIKEIWEVLRSAERGLRIISEAEPNDDSLPGFAKYVLERLK